MIKRCPHCQNEFNAKQNDRNYCSRACGYAARSARVVCRQEKACEQCGKVYEYDHAGTRVSRYCSRACLSLSQRVERMPLCCEQCGKECAVRPSIVAQFRFCSRRCQAMKNAVGKWIGVKAENRLTQPDRYESPYWRKQAARARCRDGYQCQACQMQFVKGTARLDVHHLIPVRLGGSDHLSNLISLCRSCHAKADYAIRLSESSSTCIVCQAALPLGNMTGYCALHYEHSPQRLAANRVAKAKKRTGPRVIVGLTHYTCPTCRKSFIRQRSRVKVAVPYCGRSCYQAARADRVT